jgi:hypothetical protein
VFWCGFAGETLQYTIYCVTRWTPTTADSTRQSRIGPRLINYGEPGPNYTNTISPYDMCYRNFECQIHQILLTARGICPLPPAGETTCCIPGRSAWWRSDNPSLTSWSRICAYFQSADLWIGIMCCGVSTMKSSMEVPRRRRDSHSLICNFRPTSSFQFCNLADDVRLTDWEESPLLPIIYCSAAKDGHLSLFIHRASSRRLWRIIEPHLIYIHRQHDNLTSFECSGVISLTSL